MTKPVVLKSILSKLFLLDINKSELFCECWTTNAEEIVSKLQQNLTNSYRVIIYITILQFLHLIFNN